MFMNCIHVAFWILVSSKILIWSTQLKFKLNTVRQLPYFSYKCIISLSHEMTWPSPPGFTVACIEQMNDHSTFSLCSVRPKSKKKSLSSSRQEVHCTIEKLLGQTNRLLLGSVRHWLYYSLPPCTRINSVDITVVNDEPLWLLSVPAVFTPPHFSSLILSFSVSNKVIY